MQKRICGYVLSYLKKELRFPDHPQVGFAKRRYTEVYPTITEARTRAVEILKSRLPSPNARYTMWEEQSVNMDENSQAAVYHTIYMRAYRSDFRANRYSITIKYHIYRHDVPADPVLASNI